MHTQTAKVSLGVFNITGKCPAQRYWDAQDFRLRVKPSAALMLPLCLREACKHLQWDISPPRISTQHVAAIESRNEGRGCGIMQMCPLKRVFYLQDKLQLKHFHHFCANPLSLPTLHHFPCFESTPKSVNLNGRVPVQMLQLLSSSAFTC